MFVTGQRVIFLDTQVITDLITGICVWVIVLGQSDFPVLILQPNIGPIPILKG